MFITYFELFLSKWLPLIPYNEIKNGVRNRDSYQANPFFYFSVTMDLVKKKNELQLFCATWRPTAFVIEFFFVST